ncbi:MAG: hypothetical protein K0Q52_3594 [Microbacterium sp.]|nr:hypothetical protein [Microbacterium sp.]
MGRTAHPTRHSPNVAVLASTPASSNAAIAAETTASTSISSVGSSTRAQENVYPDTSPSMRQGIGEAPKEP